MYMYTVCIHAKNFWRIKGAEPPSLLPHCLAIRRASNRAAMQRARALKCMSRCGARRRTPPRRPLRAGVRRRDHPNLFHL